MRFHQQPAAFWVFSKTVVLFHPEKVCFRMPTKWFQNGVRFDLRKRNDTFFPKPRKYTKIWDFCFWDSEAFFSIHHSLNSVGAFFLQILQSKDSSQQSGSPQIYFHQKTAPLLSFFCGRCCLEVLFFLCFSHV